MSEVLENGKEAGVAVFDVFNQLSPVVKATSMDLAKGLVERVIEFFGRREIYPGIQPDPKAADDLENRLDALLTWVNETSWAPVHQVRCYAEIIRAVEKAVTSAVQVLRGQQDYFPALSEARTSLAAAFDIAIQGSVTWDCEYTLAKHSELHWSSFGQHYLSEYENPAGEKFVLLVQSHMMSNNWHFSIYRDPDAVSKAPATAVNKVTEMAPMASKSGFICHQEARMACEVYLDRSYPKGTPSES